MENTRGCWVFQEPYFLIIRFILFTINFNFISTEKIVIWKMKIFVSQPN